MSTPPDAVVDVVGIRWSQKFQRANTVAAWTIQTSASVLHESTLRPGLDAEPSPRSPGEFSNAIPNRFPEIAHSPTRLPGPLVSANVMPAPARWPATVVRRIVWPVLPLWT